MNCTIGPPGLNNLAFQRFSNLHCKSGVLPVLSETMTELLDSQHFSCVSFSRGRDGVAWTLPGPKVGGGAAIVYNNTRFASEEEMIGVPDGV